MIVKKFVYNEGAVESELLTRQQLEYRNMLYNVKHASAIFTKVNRHLFPFLSTGFHIKAVVHV